MLLLLLLVGASLQLLTLAALVTACGDVHRHGLAGGDRGGVPEPEPLTLTLIEEVCLSLNTDALP